jgi:hypothetical protein
MTIELTMLWGTASVALSIATLWMLNQLLNTPAETSRKYRNVSIVLCAAALVSLASVAGTYSEVVLSSILAVMLPGGYFFLEERERKLRDNLTQIEKSIKARTVFEAIEEDAELKLSPNLRAALLNVFEYITQAVPMLRMKLADGGILQPQLDMMNIKMKSSVQQAIDGEFFIRSDEFDKFAWERLTLATNIYASVCDLSMYADVDAKEGFDLNEWIKRVDKEIKHLSTLTGLREFRKIILYEERLINTDRVLNPPCKDGGQCSAARCPVESCLVSHVFNKWKTDFKEKTDPLSIKVDLSVVRRKDFDTLSKIDDYMKSRGRGGREFRSVDIGIFGDGFIGEEYKIRSSAAPIAGISVFNRLYIIRRDQERAEHALSKLGVA